jgi:copper chaperone CopZ
MKTIKLLSIAILSSLMIACGSTESNSNNTSTEVTAKAEHSMIKVWGNCGMCKKTIETAIADIDGLSKGEWDVEKKVLHVEFDASKTSVEKISQAVAGSGYDTEFDTATKDAYNGLHSCCQYQRTKGM